MNALVAAPVLLPWLAAPIVALADGRRRPVAFAAIAALAGTFAITAVLTAVVLRDGPHQVVAGGWAPGIGISLRADALGLVFALLSMGVLLAVLCHEVAGGVRTRHFPAVVLFMTAGLTGLFLTGDVFNFFVFFEMAMTAAYVMTLYNAERHESAGALIFATVNLLGSFVFLLAVAAIYHVTGTLEMASVADQLSQADTSVGLMIAVAVFVAFGVKLGLFPFHFWLPPVYISASPAVAAALSGALANIGAYGLLRFGAGMLEEQLEFASVVVIGIGATSLLYGALQAVARRASEEVIAYSAIGQVGYVLIAIGVGGEVGFAAAVLYAVVNSLNKTLLFLAAGLRGWLVGTAFVIGAFSVVGLPPAAGFLGKAALFRAGIEAESIAIVVLLVVGGALSFVYMFQAYQHEFWVERAGDTARSSAQSRAVLVTVALVVLALGMWPEPLLAISDEAAGALAEGAR